MSRTEVAKSPGKARVVSVIREVSHVRCPRKNVARVIDRRKNKTPGREADRGLRVLWLASRKVGRRCGVSGAPVAKPIPIIKIDCCADR